MPDVNNLGTEPQGAGAAYPIQQTGNVSPPAAGIADDREIDTQSRSRQEVDAVIANSANPMLSMPVHVTISLSGNAAVSGVASASFTAKMFQQIEDIKMSVLDGWSKNIKEIAERDERDRNSPQYKAKLDRQTSQFLAELARMSPEASINAAINSPEFGKILQKVSPLEKAALTESTRSYATISGMQSFSAQQGAAAAGMLAMMGGIGGVAGIETVIQGNTVVTTVENVAGSLTNVTQSIVPAASQAMVADMNAMILMMGTFFSDKIMSFSAAETAVNAAKKGEKPKSLDVALNFSRNIVSLVTDPGFNAFINNHVISRMPGADKLSETQKEQLTSLIRIVMLGTAVGLLSKAEMGWINPAQFKEIIAGRTTLDGPHDARHNLIAALMKESESLDKAGSSVKARKNAVIDGLGKALASLNTSGKREVDSRMMDIVAIFEKVGANLNAQLPISASAR